MGEEEKVQEELTEKAPDSVPNGLVITLVSNPNGEEQIQIQTLGETKVLEAPTILKLAVKQVEEQLGI